MSEIKSFYIHLRHPKNDANLMIPFACVIDWRKGPYFLFEKEDRILELHTKFFPKLANCPKFEYKKNFKVEIENSIQRSAYLNQEGKFIFNGKLLKSIKSP